MPRTLGPHSRLRLRMLAFTAALLVSLVLAPGLGTLGAAGAEAKQPPPGPIEIGTSFSPWRAEALGLDPAHAFADLLAMHFRVIRLAVRWDQVESDGYRQTDLLVRMAERARQPIVLEVGMKSLGWPEFYLPPGLPPAPDGGDAAASPTVRDEVLTHVRTTVLRYRSSRALIAWQVENEPFNPAGPHRWYVDAETVRAEMAAVRALDRRPLVVNAFTHFNLILDHASSRSGFSPASFLGFDAPHAESDVLNVERRGDVLGLDVYRRIGYRIAGRTGVTTADSDWADRASHWLAAAQSQHKGAWVMEAQAEPWEPTPSTQARPISLHAGDIQPTVGALQSAGFKTVLLWGSEYWLWRARSGDHAWLGAVDKVLAQQRGAPPVQTR